MLPARNLSSYNFDIGDQKYYNSPLPEKILPNSHYSNQKKEEDKEQENCIVM
jgi:hypothetical protein